MKYYFTFGSNHLASNGASLGQNYAVIEAKNEGEARAKMNELRGVKWSMCYSDISDFGVDKYGLLEVQLHDIKLQFYAVLSLERMMFWKTQTAGYVEKLDNAYRFTEHEAVDLCYRANLGSQLVEEVMYPIE